VGLTNWWKKSFLITPAVRRGAGQVLFIAENAKCGTAEKPGRVHASRKYGKWMKVFCADLRRNNSQRVVLAGRPKVVR